MARKCGCGHQLMIRVARQSTALIGRDTLVEKRGGATQNSTPFAHAFTPSSVSLAQQSSAPNVALPAVALLNRGAAGHRHDGGDSYHCGDLNCQPARLSASNAVS